MKFKLILEWQEETKSQRSRKSILGWGNSPKAVMSLIVYQSAQAAITEYRRLGGFSTRTLKVLEAGKPKIMLLADSVHGEDSSWPVDGLFLAVVSGGFSVCTLGRSGCERERERHWPYWILNLCLQRPYLQYSHTGVTASVYEWWERRIKSVTGVIN